MSFLKRVFGSKELVVDPLDLQLPESVATDMPGVTLKKSKPGNAVEIEIVGESFRAANIAAVAKASAGREFDIYLVPEPTNQYDKKAVAVYAANLHVGYIAKPGNRQWFKWVNEALERGELLWGPGKAISRQGTNNIGIFGSIHMPSVGRDVEDLVPQELTKSALLKHVDKAIALSNSFTEPDTVAQAKSLSKKAVVIASPLAAHAKWMSMNTDNQASEFWDELLSVCDSILDTNRDVAYATDESEFNVAGEVEELGQIASRLRSLLEARD